MLLSLVPEKTLWTCEKCGQNFARPEHVQIHSWRHIGMEPFTCDLCGEGFMQTGLLIRHRRHCTQRIAAEKTLTVAAQCVVYKCHICRKMYKNQLWFERHMHSHGCDIKFDTTGYKLIKPVINCHSENRVKGQCESQHDDHIPENVETQKIQENFSEKIKSVIQDFGDKHLMDQTIDKSPGARGRSTPIDHSPEKRDDNQTSDGAGKDQSPDKCLQCPICFFTYKNSSALKIHLPHHRSTLNKKTFLRRCRHRRF